MADSQIEHVRRSTQAEVPQKMVDLGGGLYAASVAVSGSVTVADGGASLTVDGPLTNSELRATAVDVQNAGTDVPTGAPILGQKKIGVTGTAVQLNSNSVALPGGMVIVAAHPDNAAKMTVGSSAVTNTVDGTGNGAILAPGEAIAVFVANVNLVYINGTANDIASYSAG